MNRCISFLSHRKFECNVSIRKSIRKFVCKYHFDQSWKANIDKTWCDQWIYSFPPLGKNRIKFNVQVLTVCHDTYQDFHLLNSVSSTETKHSTFYKSSFVWDTSICDFLFAKLLKNITWCLFFIEHVSRLGYRLKNQLHGRTAAICTVLSSKISVNIHGIFFQRQIASLQKLLTRAKPTILFMDRRFRLLSTYFWNDIIFIISTQVKKLCVLTSILNGT